MSCILVVDDDPAIREMVGMALTREGHEWLEAGNVLEARQLITTHKPDLILLDWMLPDNPVLNLPASCKTINPAVPRPSSC